MTRTRNQQISCNSRWTQILPELESSIKSCIWSRLGRLTIYVLVNTVWASRRITLLKIVLWTQRSNCKTFAWHEHSLYIPLYARLDLELKLRCMIRLQTWHLTRIITRLRLDLYWYYLVCLAKLTEYQDFRERLCLVASLLQMSCTFLVNTTEVIIIIIHH